jgi:glycopeptide antibiotics resistance protein
VFGEVAALPVVAPVAAVAFGVLLWGLHRRGAMTLPRVLVAAALCVYGAGVVANTVFPIFLDMPGGVQPWSASISMRLFDDYGAADAVQNVVVFLPVGVLVPLALRTHSPWRVAAVGAVFSLFIENDLFYNALGAPLGYGLFVLVTRVPAVARLAQRTRWPST